MILLLRSFNHYYDTKEVGWGSLDNQGKRNLEPKTLLLTGLKYFNIDKIIDDK